LFLEGFTSFREPTTIDFDEADYFALVGPTGSGKSSIIDAIAFALYGCVPRYEDRRLVAPVISQGRLEARVGLDFALGPEHYRAVRVVRATGKAKGATTKEARLERVDPSTGEPLELLGGDADEVTRAAEQLLGLTFDHFTKCVILPQGAFARFLHDKPAERQDLMVRLLDLGIYEKVAAAANREATEAEQQSSALAASLERPPLVGATPDALVLAGARVRDLGAVRVAIDAARPEVSGLEDLLRASDETVRAVTTGLEVLGSIRSPKGIDALAAGVREARADEEHATAEAHRLEGETVEAEKAVAALPARAVLDAVADALAERDELDARLEKGRAMVAEAAASVAAGEAALEGARVEAAAAQAGRDAALMRFQADALAHQLVVGDVCPVCRQTVTALPPADSDATAIEEADDLVARARALEQAAADDLGSRRTELTRRESQLAALGDRRDAVLERLAANQLERELAAGRSLELDVAAGRSLERHVVVQRKVLDRAEAALAEARRAERAALEVGRAARAEAQRRAEQETQARHAFDAARDRVAVMGPPPAERIDLAADWAALLSWTGSQAETLRKARDAAAAEHADTSRELQTLVDRLLDVCAASGVQIPTGAAGVDPVGAGHRAGVGPVGSERTALVAAVSEAAAAEEARATSDAARLEEAIVEAARVRAETARAGERAEVARTLGRHLGARNFEKWLLDGALQALVDGATLVLQDLSSGAYSMILDATGFAVVDHRNADAVRSARTLSGGETFLASLALALSLADQLAAVSSGTATRLEAIFLDEGFGSLDTETLDVVAAAIEGLAAGGRVVCVVTHVRELAERIPIRFEVSRMSGTSQVQRVES